MQKNKLIQAQKNIKMLNDFIKNPKKEGEKVFSQKMIDDTKKYQKKYGFNSRENNKEFSTHNNEADAFKHTYMQAWLTVKGRETAAKFLGDMHENDGKDRNQPSGEENMDLWNNNQGRQIGREVNTLIKKYKLNRYSTDTDDLIAKKVIERMNAGKLITHPSDSRRYVPINAKGKSTGFAASVSNSNSSQPTKNEASKTASQKFSDQIRDKFRAKQNASNKNLSRIIKSHSSTQGTGKGHWVTMNGAHVFIED